MIADVRLGTDYIIDKLTEGKEPSSPQKGNSLASTHGAASRQSRMA